MSWTPPLHADLSPWPTSTHRWWASTTWVAQSYPSLLCRAQKVFHQAGWAMSPSEADAIQQDLLPLVSHAPGASIIELTALREQVGRLRRARPGVGLEPLELTVIALDVTNRFLAGNPFVEAVDAMGWQRVPSAHASFAVELGLLARQWRIGQNDVPPPNAPVAAGLGRVLAVAQRVANAREDFAWARELHRTKKQKHDRGARWMGGGFKYLLEMLERLPRTEPCNLAVYETIADEADADLRASVEHAIAVFVETLRSPELAASAALRAAIRRVVSGDDEGAFERGKEAFERMIAVHDRFGACCAAVLLGSIREHDSGELARWIEHALRWARGHETKEVQLLLLQVLGAARKGSGDHIGERRLFAEARRLVADDPEAWEALSASWRGEHGLPEEEPDDPEQGARKPPTLPPGLEQLGRALDGGALTEAYALLGAYIGELLESHADGAVVHMLLGHIEQLGDGRSKKLDLLRAWSCAAVTELVQHDHELWCTSKAMQLDLEDRLGVTEELIMVGAESLQLSILLLDLVDEPLVGVEGFELPPPLEPGGRAMQCIAEAEHAMQQGQTQRARFWIDRAQLYRARMAEA